MITTADSGHEAIDVARRWRPDILLTDVVMPGMDGVEAAKRICALLPDCRVFLLTAQNWCIGDPRFHADRGCEFQLLRKPIHPRELIERLWACIRSDGRHPNGDPKRT